MLSNLCCNLRIIGEVMHTCLLASTCLLAFLFARFKIKKEIWNINCYRYLKEKDSKRTVCPYFHCF